MGKHRLRDSHGAAEATTDVRRAVLDGALDIIAIEGADALSMREVARRAGVSHQAPYHYFGDRAGIFAAISEEGFTNFTVAFSNALETSDDPLTSCLETYVSFALQHPGHYRVMFRSDICGVTTHEPTRVAADKAFLTLLDLAQIVNPTPSAGLDAFTLPVTLWAHAHGLATLLMDGPLLAKLPPGTDPADLIHNVSQLFSRSIKNDINS